MIRTVCAHGDSPYRGRIPGELQPPENQLEAQNRGLGARHMSDKTAISWTEATRNPVTGFKEEK